MSKFEDTDEYRITKSTFRSSSLFLCEQKVLVWRGWNPWAKKPSSYVWTTVLNNGRGAGFDTLEEAQSFLEKKIELMKIPHEFEIVYERKAQEK